MASSFKVFKQMMASQFTVVHVARIPAVGLTCIRNNSNTTSLSRLSRTYHPRTYPTLLVFPDGSTINIRCTEPRKIIKLPLDLSKLSEAEKRKVLANRKPKQKLEKIEDFGERIDISEYSKYFKQ